MATRMKTSGLIVIGLLIATSAILLIWQRRLEKMRQENNALRLSIEQLEATIKELSPPANPSSDSTQPEDEQHRELMKLRAEVSTLRREHDDLLKQLAAKTRPPQTARRQAVEAWVQQILNGTPSEQGLAAGSLRGKLLRREATNVSPAELSLRDELLKRQLNQTLERSPAEFADFQSSFIQSVVGISDEPRILQMHELIQRTYEQAVANGLDIPSKPTSGTDEWVERRFALDRAASFQLKQMFTPDERALFDRAFLGIMGVDLGGVGVDKSNYPKRLFGE